MTKLQAVVGKDVLDSGIVRADVLNKSAQNFDLIMRCFNTSEGNYGWCVELCRNRDSMTRRFNSVSILQGGPCGRGTDDVDLGLRVAF